MNRDFTFRFDTLYAPKVMRPRDVLLMDSVLGAPRSFNYMGIEVREAEYAEAATRTVFRVVKSHPNARRRRYSVQKSKEPCVLVVRDPLSGRQMVIVHPALFPALQKGMAA